MAKGVSIKTSKTVSTARVKCTAGPSSDTDSICVPQLAVSGPTATRRREH